MKRIGIATTYKIMEIPSTFPSVTTSQDELKTNLLA
jgi:hypothetical protein